MLIRVLSAGVAQVKIIIGRKSTLIINAFSIIRPVVSVACTLSMFAPSTSQVMAIDRLPLMSDIPVLVFAIPVMVTTAPLSRGYHCLRYQVSVNQLLVMTCQLLCETTLIKIRGSDSAINLPVLYGRRLNTISWLDIFTGCICVARFSP